MAKLRKNGWVRGNIDRVLLQDLDGNDVEDALVGGSKNNGCSEAVVVGTEPVRCRNTPAITGNEAWEVVLGHCGPQVIADTGLVFEELESHDGTDRVAAMVPGIRIARSVTEEPGDRIEAARLQCPTKDVASSAVRAASHTPSLPAPRRC
jgi:hypothetical protein